MKPHLLFGLALLLLLAGCYSYRRNLPVPENPGCDGQGLSWPNEQSRANSDRWLVEHHSEVRCLRPRVLVVNFVNGFSDAQATAKVKEVFAAYKTATRFHGYAVPDAPSFIDFQLARLVNLADPAPAADYPFENSSRYPRRKTQAPFGDIDYGAFFGPELAQAYGYTDERGKFLDLCTLVDAGLVNELWIIGSGDRPDAAAYEALEAKQRYNAAREALPGRFERCAGNGCFEVFAPMCRRSLRIGFINYNRGVGCFLESLGHSFERMADSNAIPYLRPYFREFAGLDLKERFGATLDSWYECSYKHPPDCVTFPEVASDHVVARYQTDSTSGTLDRYLPACGNAHFPPNGRNQYDIVNAQEVPSRCEHFRMRDGENGGDRVERYSVSKLQPYKSLAPDCTGPWEVYWRQNFPGLDNRAIDDRGEPMLNWWPFLYY